MIEDRARRAAHHLNANPQYNDRLVTLYARIAALSPAGASTRSGPAAGGGMLAVLFDAQGARTALEGKGRTRELAAEALLALLEARPRGR